MLLAPGTRLGSYEIHSALGAGGMGEVYKAHDTHLGRDVALKILPDSFARDADRVARFRREAHVLASLNHPHIDAIYGLDEANGAHFLVLELVDGESLASRIARGRLPVDEALSIARQIASAFEAAHEKGIIHRDLKPANVALTADGHVKVLDFGLAKAMEPTSGAAITNSPTFTSPAMMTGAGVILGTAAYMSPEQAKGRAADKRSDVWAFGCVLFEMLSGRRPFEGDDVSETLAATLKSEPDWAALPATVPQPVRTLMKGCLRKDRAERISDISTARFLIEQAGALAQTAATGRAPTRSAWPWVLAVAGAVLVGALAGAALVYRPRPQTPPSPVSRFVLTLPLGQQLTIPRQAVTISPDGTRLVYAADGRLYIRAISELEPRAIPGADPAIGPVFSPDGQWVLFWMESTLKRISVNGGTPVPVCRASPGPSGVTWDDDGIWFAQPGTGIMRVSPHGGEPETVVAVDSQDNSVHGPQLLPGGDAVLFTLSKGWTSATAGVNRWESAQVVAQSRRTGQRRILFERGTDARYVPTGHIVYALGGTLFARSFDLARLEVTSGPVPIVEGVGRVDVPTVGSAQFAFSGNGTLVYIPGPTSAGQQDLFLFDRKGAAESLKLPQGSYVYPRVSPDGRRIAFESNNGKEAYVSIYDLSGASSVRRLTDGGNNRFPIWSADGTRVAFQSDREGDLAVWWQPADGGTAERLTRPEKNMLHQPESWSPKGDTLLFSALTGTEWRLWTLSLSDRKTAPFADVTSITFPTDAAFSSDGKWVAYQVGTKDVGEATTYVQPFPADGQKHQIARGGRPVWSRDGRELFFVPGPGRFMVTAVTTQPNFRFTTPVAIPRGFGIADPASPRSYDVMPDGRILGIGISGGGPQNAAPGELHLVLNWFEDLKARVPGK